MQLSESIYMVASGMLGFSFTHVLDCNVFLIDTGDGVILIDSGVNMEVEKMDAVIRSHGFELTDVKKILLTHYHADHACGAARIKQISGCDVYAPAREARAIETGDEAATSVELAKGGFYPEDYIYPKCPGVKGMNDSETVSLGNVSLTAYMVPGHSLEDMVVYGEIDGKKTMFSGDVVFAGGQVLLQPLHDVTIAPYAAGMRKLAELEVEALFPGHGVFSLEDGGRHIKAAVDKFNAGTIPPQFFYFA